MKLSHGEYPEFHRLIAFDQNLSSYFRKMAFIFSSAPFYICHVKLPTANDPVPPEIHWNSKFYPYCIDALGAIDGSHIHLHILVLYIKTARVSYLKTAFLLACFAFSFAMPSRDGRDQQLMLVYGQMLSIMSLSFWRENITLQMQGSLHRGVHYHLAEWGRASVR